MTSFSVPHSSFQLLNSPDDQGKKFRLENESHKNFAFRKELFVFWSQLCPYIKMPRVINSEKKVCCCLVGFVVLFCFYLEFKYSSA